MPGRAAHEDWHLRLFRRSVLKQAKLREVRAAMGSTRGLKCLDLGSDNGVISWHLRRGGGEWASADIAEEAVESIRRLVGHGVHRTDGRSLPFPDTAFDAVVILDMLEHVEDDRQLLRETARVLRDGGRLVVNVPHWKKVAVLRPLRRALGLTDAWHGHLRPGYTLKSLTAILPPEMQVISSRTYSRFFSELLDTAINAAFSRAGRAPSTAKGTIVTEQELTRRERAFRAFGAVYPGMWLLSRLDWLLLFTRGHSLIVTVRKGSPRPPAAR